MDQIFVLIGRSDGFGIGFLLSDWFFFGFGSFFSGQVLGVYIFLSSLGFDCSRSDFQGIFGFFLFFSG